ncbi:hypothetical protein EfmAA96_20960 [Enterococcus faecium]|nr:hypothetical protein EfmAA96_20960 [Enterococcus faecium]
MLNKTLQKLQEKLGKAALPFLLFLFLSLSAALHLVVSNKRSVKKQFYI